MIIYNGIINYIFYSLLIYSGASHLYLWLIDYDAVRIIKEVMPIFMSLNLKVSFLTCVQNLFIVFQNHRYWR